MFSKDRNRVQPHTDTIAKYLDKIPLHPEQEKCRKIKRQNTAFQEHINCLEGTYEFFEATDFQEALLPVTGQEGPQEFCLHAE